MALWIYEVNMSLTCTTKVSGKLLYLSGQLSNELYLNVPGRAVFELIF